MPLPSASQPQEDRPRLSILDRLRASKAARSAANDVLLEHAQRAVDESPLPAIQDVTIRDSPGSGVHGLPPAERLTMRRASLKEARAARKEGSEHLKRTAMGVSCYSDSKMFKMPPELDEEEPSEEEVG